MLQKPVLVLLKFKKNLYADNNGSKCFNTFKLTYRYILGLPYRGVDSSHPDNLCCEAVSLLENSSQPLKPRNSNIDEFDYKTCSV